MANTAKQRVCIIGCGPSGMSTLFHLGKLSDAEMPDIVCYEKQAEVGGIWNVSWRTGLDEYGEPSYCSMYYDLWINNPHCNNEYPDYSFEEHFGKSLPAYVPRAVVRDYLEGRFVQGSKRDLKQFIRFSTVVRRVEYNKVTDEFTVTVNHLNADREEIETFSHVVVASGMFSTPKIPDVPGIEGFKGRVLHSKNVKHVHEFKGQRILIIGSFLSAEDLAIMLSKFGATRVIIAYKYRPLGRNWPNGIEERHLAVKFEGNTVYFQDGTNAIVDNVLFCTGYRLEFPFMSEELRLKTELLFYPENLYKGVLWINGGNNKLMYIGMQYMIVHFITYDCQAIWAVRCITGKISLPCTEEMYADSMKWVEMVKEATKNHCFKETFEFIKKYFRHIVDSVDYSKDVLKLVQQFEKKRDEQCKDICTWRDKEFDCIYTGNPTPALKTPWMNNTEDCVESFIKHY